MPIVYESKLDWWLGAILAFAICFSAGYSVYMMAMGGPRFWWLALVTTAVGSGLPLWILLTTRYTIDGEMLFVKSGPITWRVPIAEITDIRPTRNPLSSPALSIDRLRIEYSGCRSIMISPREKEHFLAEIERLRTASRI
jgi:hypothetical protein